MEMKGTIEHRKIKKKSRYVIALVLTLAIFIIGLLLGVMVSGERASFLQKELSQQNLDYESLQTQYLYLIDGQEKNCNAINRALEENIANLESTRIKLEGYLMQTLITDHEDYIQLKREYMLAEIRYWILSQQTAEYCERDSISLLYFYENDEDCLDCRAQGRVLTVLKEEFGDKLMIFSLDSNFSGEPMIDIIKKEYGVEEVPTMIIQETGDIYSGLITKDKLKKDLNKIYEKIQ